MQIDHKKVNTLRSFFGVKLRGNETWDELLQIEKDNKERILVMINERKTNNKSRRAGKITMSVVK